MLFERKNNRIRFIDTDYIDYETWQKILNRFNYLGYDIKDTDTLKEYFDEHTFLQPDQSIETLKIFNLMHDDNKISENEIKNVNARAKKHFGITDNLHIAGYILTDGNSLKFSYDNISRNIDHRDISEILTEIDTNKTNSAAMIEFMKYGNIRITSCGLDMSKRPNKKQRPVIANFIKLMNRINRNMQIDISNNNGNTVKSFNYDFPIFTNIINDIDEYFDSIKI